MMIDLNALREALEWECWGAFYGGDLDGVLVQLAEAQNPAPEELIALAEEMGCCSLDLGRFEIQER